MRTYLVTGGAGFIGSHVCDRLLADGNRVVAIDDLSTGHLENLSHARRAGHAFEFVRMDIREPGVRRRFERIAPDVVVHLAAQSGVRPSLRDPVHDASVNVVGFVQVLEATVASGARKVIYPGSGGTMYGRPRRLPALERARRGSRAQNPYAITKKVAEDYLHFYRRTRSLDFTLLALSNVYGPRQDPMGEAGVIAIWGQAMLAGQQPTMFGPGDQTRDYVYVSDVVDALVLAADRASGRVLNIATGVETSARRIFELLAEETGFRRDPLRAPSPGDDLRRIALDPTVAESILGWRPRTPLREGIRYTLSHLREQFPAR